MQVFKLAAITMLANSWQETFSTEWTEFSLAEFSLKIASDYFRNLTGTEKGFPRSSRNGSNVWKTTSSHTSFAYSCLQWPLQLLYDQSFSVQPVTGQVLRLFKMPQINKNKKYCLHSTVFVSYTEATPTSLQSFGDRKKCKWYFFPISFW